MRRGPVLLAGCAVVAVAGVLLPSITEKQSIGDARIVNVVVNGGHAVVLGPRSTETFGFSITAQDDSGIRSVDHVGVWGGNYGVLKPSAVVCKVTSVKTVSVCTGTATVDLAKHQIWDDQAGLWRIQATVHANDGDKTESDEAGTFLMQKEATAVIFGVPGSAKAGQTISITGSLETPDWRTNTWVANPKQYVQLRFTPKGSTTPHKVAAVYSDAAGNLSYTTKVTGTGTYSWFYYGKTWSAPVESLRVQVTVPGS